MTRQTIIVVMSVMVFGCSHTRQFTSYDEINSRAKGKLAKIELAQGVNIRGRDIQITPDSTYWIETRKLLKHAVPTSQVHKIVIVDRGRGAWEGFRGFVAAGAVMSVFEFMRGDEPPGLFSFTAGEKFILVNAMGIMYGVYLGLPLGVLIGSKDVYVLNEAGASGSEPLTEDKGRSDPTRNGATQLRAPHPDSEQKTLSASFVFATTSSGPAKDLENAMIDAGYNESSYGFFSGETISHPLSRTGFGTTGFPRMIRVDYQFRPLMSAGLDISRANIGFTSGEHEKFGSLFIRYSVTSIATVFSYRLAPRVSLGIGPGLYYTKTWKDNGGGEGGQSFTRNRIGFLIDLSAAIPFPYSRFFVELNGQYRRVGRVSIGPFTSGYGDNIGSMGSAQVSYDHFFIGLGLGFGSKIVSTGY